MAVQLSDEVMDRLIAACNSATWFLARVTGDQIALSPDMADAPSWAEESIRESLGVVMDGGDIRDIWRKWSQSKKNKGWVYGEVKDPDANPPTHPCLVDDYEDLSPHERFKDQVFAGLLQLAQQGQL